MNNLLKQYINKITINNINDFAIKNNINLNKSELNFLYDFIKKNYQQIIDDIKPFEPTLKQNLQEENYNKTLNLYNKYKQIYTNYLI